ncbi:hypothetical protein [Sulfurimonas sp.]
MKELNVIAQELLMKVQNRLLVTVPFIASIIFSGCATKTAQPKVVIKKITIDEVNRKETTYPVLKENNSMQRAIVDMGVVLKTKITSYKDESGSLIASHNVFFWAKRPDFITTNTLPRRKIKHEYSGLKINLNKTGVVDIDEAISQQAVKNQKITTYDRKINSFLNKNAK